MHGAPEALRLKIKELVAEYAEPNDPAATETKRKEAPTLAPTQRGGEESQQRRYVP
jgi:hypothetical protein